MKKRPQAQLPQMADCPACHSRMLRTRLDAHMQQCPRLLAIAARTPRKPTSKPQQYLKAKEHQPTQRRKNQPIQTRTDTKQPTSQRQRTLEQSWAAQRNTPPHTAQSSNETAAAKSSPLSLQETKRTERLTKDGYRIDECWQCKRRICLIPSKGDYRVYDINFLGQSGGPHLCDGEDGSLDSLDRADSFSSQRAIVAIKKRLKGGLKKR